MSRLTELRAALRQAEADRQSAANLCRELRAEITRERAASKLLAEEGRAERRRQILSRLDTGMTSKEIAAAVGCSWAVVELTIKEWRQDERVHVRRGRTLPERRRLR